MAASRTITQYTDSVSRTRERMDRETDPAIIHELAEHERKLLAAMAAVEHGDNPKA
jgi:hypothetical protein